MPEVSAGLLLYRRPEHGAGLELLLVHPGGPYWAKKETRSWSVPKGNVEEGEDPLAAARREFREETGYEIDDVAALPGAPTFVSLGAVKYRNHKVVRAWAVEGDCDAAAVRSVTFEMEWPRGSGRMQSFPEVDRAAWFDLSSARAALLSAQRRFIDELEALVGRAPGA